MPFLVIYFDVDSTSGLQYSTRRIMSLLMLKSIHPSGASILKQQQINSLPPILTRSTHPLACPVLLSAHRIPIISSLELRIVLPCEKASPPPTFASRIPTTLRLHLRTRHHNFTRSTPFVLHDLLPPFSLLTARP